MNRVSSYIFLFFLITNFVMAEEQTNIFFKCCKDGNLECVKNFINQNYDINSINKNNSTALHLAVQTGNYSITEFLLFNGANTKIKDSFGKTALDYANTDSLIVLFLLKGADPSELIRVTNKQLFFKNSNKECLEGMQITFENRIPKTFRLQSFSSDVIKQQEENQKAIRKYQEDLQKWYTDPGIESEYAKSVNDQYKNIPTYIDYRQMQKDDISDIDEAERITNARLAAGLITKDEYDADAEKNLGELQQIRMQSAPPIPKYINTPMGYRDTATGAYDTGVPASRGPKPEKPVMYDIPYVEKDSIENAHITAITIMITIKDASNKVLYKKKHTIKVDLNEGEQAPSEEFKLSGNVYANDGSFSNSTASIDIEVLSVK